MKPDLRVLPAALVALLAGACGNGGAAGPSSDAGAHGETNRGDTSLPDGDAGAPTHREQLASAARTSPRLQGEDWAVKYLAPWPAKDRRRRSIAPCLFQNTARYPLHLGFLRSFPDWPPRLRDATWP